SSPTRRSSDLVCITRLPLGWNGAYRHFRHPLDYIGSEGGGGVGAGPGITVGAALALKDSGRLPVAIMGDGDFLMGATALWTAAHYGIPCLILVAKTVPSSTTSCTRSASRRSALARWRTA